MKGKSKRKKAKKVKGKSKKEKGKSAVPIFAFFLLPSQRLETE
jgi:hypothetical protein